MGRGCLNSSSRTQRQVSLYMFVGVLDLRHSLTSSLYHAMNSMIPVCPSQTLSSIVCELRCYSKSCHFVASFLSYRMTKLCVLWRISAVLTRFVLLLARPPGPS